MEVNKGTAATTKNEGRNSMPQPRAGLSQVMAWTGREVPGGPKQLGSPRRALLARRRLDGRPGDRAGCGKEAVEVNVHGCTPTFLPWMDTAGVESPR